MFAGLAPRESSFIHLYVQLAVRFKILIKRQVEDTNFRLSRVHRAVALQSRAQWHDKILNVDQALDLLKDHF